MGLDDCRRCLSQVAEMTASLIANGSTAQHRARINLWRQMVWVTIEELSMERQKRRSRA